MHHLLLLSILFALGACDGTGRPLQPADEATGEVSVAIRVGKVAAASISRAEIVVTATGMTQIKQALTISENTISGTVRGIPAGTGRLFTINGYDASGALSYSGSATATIVAGQVAQVQITVANAATLSKPILGLRPTFLASRTYGDTSIRLEVENTGTVAATGVTITFRARNAAGAAIDDANASVGTIAPAMSVLVRVDFEYTSDLSSDSKYVSTVEYSIAHDEGTAVTGVLTVP